jgi:hypothetical protein
MHVRAVSWMEIEQHSATGNYLLVARTKQTKRQQLSLSAAKKIHTMSGGGILNIQDLLVSHRTSWGILPQTPLFTLCSARWHRQSSITASTEHPAPKDQLVSHRTWSKVGSPLKTNHVSVAPIKFFFCSKTPFLSVCPPLPSRSIKLRSNQALASHRTSWGILPQTPVFSVRSACCHWYTKR